MDVAPAREPLILNIGMKNMADRPIGTLASVFLDPDGDSDGTDFRDVPASDKGNSSYRDQGMRGGYAPHNRDNFPDPAGLKRFAGYGADEADLSRGFIADCTNDDPAYDAVNYRMRSTIPKTSNEDFGNTSQLPRDYAFRGRNQQSRGFLKRPHIPTER